MALIWRNHSTGPARCKCYALMQLHPRLQFCAPCTCVSPSIFQRHGGKCFLCTDTRGQEQWAWARGKGDAELISMVPITTAAELADDADAKGCMCLAGKATAERGILVVCTFSPRHIATGNRRTMLHGCIMVSLLMCPTYLTLINIKLTTDNTLAACGYKDTCKCLLMHLSLITPSPMEHYHRFINIIL